MFLWFCAAIGCMILLLTTRLFSAERLRLSPASLVCEQAGGRDGGSLSFPAPLLPSGAVEHQRDRLWGKLHGGEKLTHVLGLTEDLGNVWKCIKHICFLPRCPSSNLSCPLNPKMRWLVNGKNQELVYTVGLSGSIFILYRLSWELFCDDIII